jgi:hypothetical protein
MTQQNGVRSGTAGAAGQDSGWRRFGSPAGQTAAPGNPQGSTRTSPAAQAQRNAGPATSPQGGWQRFGSPAPGNTNSPAQRQTAPAPRQNYQSSPNAGRPQVRIAPPVVRERPSYSAPAQRSAPSYSAPRQSAPSAPRQSAPSNGGSHGNSGSSHSRSR